MGKIYIGQTALQFKATLGIDITGATVTQIKYIKPDAQIKYIKPDADATEGAWTAVVEDASTGIIYYNVVDADVLDEEGVWVLWGYVTLASGKSVPGEPFKKRVYVEGE
jgi:hypothetical protein